MSYILDALKKAEHERKLGDVPNLKSNSPTAVQRTQQGNKVIWILVSSLVISLVWFKPWQSQISTKPLTQSPKVTQIEMPVETSQRLPTTTLQTVPVSALTKTPIEIPINQAGSVAQETVPEPVDMPGIMDLPNHIRSKLPGIQISGHIYDATPGSRMVIINNHVEREGRHISGSLILEEITEDGIILNYSGTLFTMSVFDSWQGQ